MPTSRPPGGDQARRGSTSIPDLQRYRPSPARLPVLVVAALLVCGVLVLGFVWFGMRIEVGPGQYVVVVAKTGQDLTNDQILAPDAEHKGVQREILKEGRHFRNPYFWDWTPPLEATLVPQGKVGVLVRRFGKPLPEGRILATGPDEKGIQEKVLTPGRHYLNAHAYDVEIHPMVKIEPGYMGIVTKQVGDAPEDPFALTVEKDERGVQPDLLPPGTHPEFSHPDIYRVTKIDVRSQKFEMRGKYAISFPSKYGFDIKVEGTIEWAPNLDRLPVLFVKYVDDKDLKETGGINNIQQKVILPFARSFFRTIGGRYRAVDYITGDTRVVVQNEVEHRLMETCAEEGILIKSVVIRATEPPEAIREQFQRREIARREMERYEKEIEMQIGTPVTVDGEVQRDADGEIVREGGRLTRVIQQRMKEREQQLGDVRERVATSVRKAEAYRNIEETKAQRRVEVAGLRLEAAKDKAAGITAEGLAEAAVKVMQYEAQASGVREKVTAFGDGRTYAEFLLIRRFAPGIESILSDTEGTFARIFARFAAIEAEADTSEEQ